jgi:hypothetical protein
MVGGKVIGIVRRPDGTTLVNVRERKGQNRCGVIVTERKMDTDEPVNISLGDTIWWQGEFAFWTPKGSPQYPHQQGHKWDVCLRRHGYSFST